MKIARLMRALTSGIARLALVVAGGAVPAGHEPLPARSAITRLIFVDDFHVGFRNTGRPRALTDTIVTIRCRG